VETLEGKHFTHSGQCVIKIITAATVINHTINVVVVSGMQLKIAQRHTSTSSSTEGGSEPNLLLLGA